jgi:uncharacterized protein (TIGR03437 family)
MATRLLLWTVLCISPLLDAESFPYVDFSRPRAAGEPNGTLEATSLAQGTRVQVFADNRVRETVTAAAAQTLAAVFDRKIFRANTEHFGPLPDALSANRVMVVIHGGFPANMEGYQLDRNLDRNRLLAIYLNSTVVERSPQRAAAVLAREFERLLAAARVQRGGRPEPAWIQEALALYAEYLNGFDHNRDALRAFWAEPGASLLQASAAGRPASLGAAYSFLVYLFEQGAPSEERMTFISETIAGGVDEYLHAHYAGRLRDWAVANLATVLYRTTEAAANYAAFRYADLDPVLTIAAGPLFAKGSAVKQSVSVPQGSVRYIRIDADSRLREPSELALSVNGVSEREVEALAVLERMNGTVEVTPLTHEELRVSGFSARELWRVTLVVLNLDRSAGGAARTVEYSASVPAGECLDIAGSYQFRERGQLTCTATAMGETETDSEPLRGSGEVTIRQSGCTIEYEPPNPLEDLPLRALRRQGTVEGARVTVTGAAVVAISDEVRLTENTFTGEGTASPASLSLAGLGKFAGSGTIEGIAVQFSCTMESTADFDRLAFGPPLLGAGSAASKFERFVSPDSAGAIVGNFNLPATVAPPDAALPTTIQGVSVMMADSGGMERELPLYSVGARRIIFHIPAGTPLGVAELTVRRFGVATGRAMVQVEPLAPGLFTVNDELRGTAQGSLLREKPDGTRTREAWYTCRGQTCEVTAIDLGAAGDQVFLTLDATGTRGASEFALTIGGVTLAGTAESSDSLPGRERMTFGPLPGSLAGAGVVGASVTADGRTSNWTVLEFK